MSAVGAPALVRAASLERLRALAVHYDAMVRLREAARGGEVETPREALRACARAFPGSLRELDRRSLTALRLRAVTLHGLVADSGSAPPWVGAQLVYHGTLRALLRVRPSLRPLGDLERARARVRTDYRPAHDDEPAPEAFLAELCEAAHRPPGGRLHPVALAYLAGLLGVPADPVLEQQLFGGGRGSGHGMSVEGEHGGGD